MQDPDLKCRHFGILWHFGIFAKRSNKKSNPIFLIFRLFPTFRLSDSTALTWTDVAWYPHYIFNHCMAPDEETGRIYVLGGQRRNGPYNEDWGELRYYEVIAFFFSYLISLFLRSLQTRGTVLGIWYGTDATTRAGLSRWRQTMRRGFTLLAAITMDGGKFWF